MILESVSIPDVAEIGRLVSSGFFLNEEHIYLTGGVLCELMADDRVLCAGHYLY